MNWNKQFEKYKMVIGFVLGICFFGFFILPEIVKETPDSLRPDYLASEPIEPVAIRNKTTGQIVCTVGIDCICMDTTYYNNLKQSEVNP